MQLPPNIDANDIGMRNLDGLTPILVQTVNTAGINTTTTGVLLIKAEATATVNRIISKASLKLPRAS